MRIAGVEVSFGNQRDRGARGSQEDYFAIHTEDGPPEAALLVLADGVGGQAGGEIASVQAVHAFVRGFAGRKADAPPGQTLAECARDANRAVLEARATHDAQMASTIVAAWAQGDGFRWLSVGDSIVLLCRAGSATRLNRDHNIGADLNAGVAAGALDPAAVGGRARERAHLTSYLGMEHLAEVDISDEQPLSPGDTIVLCSDGVTDALTLREIGAAVDEAPDGAAACELLVVRALEKRRPRQDNTSAIALRLEGARRGALVSRGGSARDAQDAPTVLAETRQPGPPARKVLALVGAALLLLALVGIAWVLLRGGPASDGTGGAAGDADGGAGAASELRPDASSAGKAPLAPGPAAPLPDVLQSTPERTGAADAGRAPHRVRAPQPVRPKPGAPGRRETSPRARTEPGTTGAAAPRPGAGAAAPASVDASAAPQAAVDASTAPQAAADASAAPRAAVDAGAAPRAAVDAGAAPRAAVDAGAAPRPSVDAGRAAPTLDVGAKAAGGTPPAAP